MYAIWNIEFVKICIGRERNKFENLCLIPLKKDSIKYVQTKKQYTDARVFTCIFEGAWLIDVWQRNGNGCTFSFIFYPLQ